MVDQARRDIVDAGRRLQALGLTPGTSGNISVRTSDGLLVTPTNSRLGELEPDDLSVVGPDGRHVCGLPPSKEAPLHAGIYRVRPDIGAVVHLHATASVAWSLRAGLPERDALPPLTAYSLMRLGRVRRVPFHPPGSTALARDVENAIVDHRALLLANHGSVVADVDLDRACAAAEELEETARLALLVTGVELAMVPVQHRAALTRDSPSPVAGAYEEIWVEERWNG